MIKKLIGGTIAVGLVGAAAYYGWFAILIGLCLFAQACAR